MRVLESRLTPPFESANGLDAPTVSGLPRFKESEMRVRFPFVTVELSRTAVCPSPRASTRSIPFIPLNADDSGIPAAVMRYNG